MLLNNTNGNYIIFNFVDTINNKVEYSIYEHDGSVLYTISDILKSIDMQKEIKGDGLTEVDIYNAMIIDFGYSDYSLSSDSQNWLSPIKSNRLKLPNDLILNARKEQNSLDKVITDFLSSTDEGNLMIICKYNSIVYYNTFKTEYVSTLEELIINGTISIESKIS